MVYSMKLDNLTDEEKEKLYELAVKAGLVESDPEVLANGGSTSSDREWGEAPAPNPEVAEVTRILPPDEWVEKQIATLEAVGRENYLRGIKRPKKDPIKAGIAAQKKYEEAMKKAEVLKRREEALKKTNIDEWYSMASILGADKIVDGVVKRRFKVERFVEKYQPALKDHLAVIDAMPDITDADREKRMIENLRGLKKLKGIHRR